MPITRLQDLNYHTTGLSFKIFIRLHYGTALDVNYPPPWLIVPWSLKSILGTSCGNAHDLIRLRRHAAPLTKLVTTPGLITISLSRYVQGSDCGSARCNCRTCRVPGSSYRPSLYQSPLSPADLPNLRLLDSEEVSDFPVPS